MARTETRGTVTRLFHDKGFGFIKDAAAPVEYFFHRSGLQRTTAAFDDLAVGTRVAFTPIEGERGPRAIEVRVLEEGA